MQSGWDEDQVMEMDRFTLMEAAAEICLAEEQASVAAKAPLAAEVRSEISSPGSSALRLRELEIEKRAERDDRRAEREMETRRAEIKGEERKAKLEAEIEERRMEWEAAQAMEWLRMEQEVRLRELKLRAPDGVGGEPDGQIMGGRRQDDTLVGVPKRSGTLCVTFCLKCRPRAPNSHNFSRPSRNCS